MAEPSEDQITAAQEATQPYRKFISERPALLSLLYDIDLLPEQIRLYVNANRMIAVCELFKLIPPGTLEEKIQCTNPLCCACIGLIFACGDDPDPQLVQRWNARFSLSDGDSVNERQIAERYAKIAERRGSSFDYESEAKPYSDIAITGKRVGEHIAAAIRAAALPATERGTA